MAACLGCACTPIAESLEKCKCGAKPLLGTDLKYKLDKLKSHDGDWYNAIMGGHEWHILSSDMDKEQPEAARIISLSLNKKNQIAMATEHMKIMRTLVKLCDPDPKTLEVPYDRVRGQLLKLFGSVIDDPGFFLHSKLCV